MTDDRGRRGDTFHSASSQQPRWAGRSPARNALMLACLGAFVLAMAALALGVADAFGLSLGVSFGLAWPAVALVVTGIALWSVRSRR